MPAVAPDYTPIAILIAAVMGLAAVIMVLTHIIGPKRTGPIKDSTYESGVEPIGDTRRRFNVRFYLVAVLFVVFDVEIIFLYPWATLFPRFHAQGDTIASAWRDAVTAAGYTPAYLATTIGLFFGLLTVGFIYEWRKGVFKWD